MNGHNRPLIKPKKRLVSLVTLKFSKKNFLQEFQIPKFESRVIATVEMAYFVKSETDNRSK